MPTTPPAKTHASDDGRRCRGLAGVTATSGSDGSSACESGCSGPHGAGPDRRLSDGIHRAARSSTHAAAAPASSGGAATSTSSSTPKRGERVDVGLTRLAERHRQTECRPGHDPSRRHAALGSQRRTRRPASAGPSTLNPYQPSPQSATRRSAASLLPPSTIGMRPSRKRLRVDPHRVEVDELARRTVATSSRHSVRMASTYSAVRAARLVERDAERVEFLSRPADTDAEGEPAAATACREMAACLATRTGLCSGSRSTPVAMRIGRRCGRDEAEPDHRIEPIRVGGNGYPAVGGVRVARRRAVDHDDVLARPQRREAGPLGGPGHRVDDVSPGAGTDAEGVQSELHAVIVSRTDEQHSRPHQGADLDEFEPDVGEVSLRPPPLVTLEDRGGAAAQQRAHRRWSA